MKTPLSGHEVTSLLRSVLAGQVNLRARTPTQNWGNTYCGIVEFEADGWTLCIFNDCGSLDYCDSARAPDGRIGTFQAWFDANEEPIDLLSEAEKDALEHQLQTCP